MRFLKKWKYGKRFLPQTFFGRALLILILPSLLIHMITTYVFYVRHWDKITSLLAENVVQKLHYSLNFLNHQGPSALPTLTQSLKIYLGQSIRLEKTPPLASLAHDPYLEEALQTRDIHDYFIYHEGEFFHIYVLTPYGFLATSVSYYQIYPRTTVIFLMWHFGTPILFLAIALIFMRNQIRPLRLLAKMADSFGKGDLGIPFKSQGAFEVRLVGKAFNTMRERIQRFITERTEMLAGISHDLKTPLTRLKIALSLHPQIPEMQEMQKDVEAMHTMIKGYLAFAQTQYHEPVQSLSLQELLHRIIRTLPFTENSIVVKPQEEMRICIQPLAFERCLRNLLENALKFSTYAEIDYRMTRNGYIILLEDNGPGIPRHLRQDAFRPFYRIDHARNQDIPGTGLGLSIVQDIVHRHGGRIQLRRASLGGLRVILFIPR